MLRREEDHAEKNVEMFFENQISQTIKLPCIKHKFSFPKPILT